MSLRNDIDSVMRSQAAVIPYGFAALLVLVGISLAFFHPVVGLVIVIIGLMLFLAVLAVRGWRRLKDMLTNSGGR